MVGVLRKARLAAGLTQAEVAASMGRSRSSVANFEACRQDTPISVVVGYAEAVGLVFLLVPVEVVRGVTGSNGR